MPENAGKFSGIIAGIVTFDIPEVDMEFLFAGLTECPEDPEEETFMLDLRDEAISDKSEI